MQDEPKPLEATPSTPEASKIESAKSWLAREFNIDAALVGVPKLSRVIGLSASTIYAHMRAGKFPIRFRVINTTPMVSLDDLAAWYCQPAPDLAPVQPLPPKERRMPSPEDGEGWLDALVQMTLDDMGSPPAAPRKRFK